MMMIEAKAGEAPKPTTTHLQWFSSWLLYIVPKVSFRTLVQSWGGHKNNPTADSITESGKNKAAGAPRVAWEPKKDCKNDNIAFPAALDALLDLITHPCKKYFFDLPLFLQALGANNASDLHLTRFWWGHFKNAYCTVDDFLLLLYFLAKVLQLW